MSIRFKRIMLSTDEFPDDQYFLNTVANDGTAYVPVRDIYAASSAAMDSEELEAVVDAVVKITKGDSHFEIIDYHGVSPHGMDGVTYTFEVRDVTEKMAPSTLENAARDLGKPPAPAKRIRIPYPGPYHVCPRCGDANMHEVIPTTDTRKVYGTRVESDGIHVDIEGSATYDDGIGDTWLACGSCFREYDWPRGEYMPVQDYA
jgi:hypothetical protein